jgi:Protein of unknown function (DUF2510)
MSDTTPPLPPAAWYRDPLGHGDARYWNGVAWTDSVSRGGVTFTAPVPPEQMRVPPVPGSEYRAQPSAPAPAAAPQSPPPKSSSGTSILVAIALVAAAALIAILVINMVTGDDDDDDDPGSTTVATTPVTDAPAPDPTDAPQPESTSPDTQG